MSGSKPKSEQEGEADLPSTIDRASLVGFLTPARPRSSAPPPKPETEAEAPRDDVSIEDGDRAETAAPTADSAAPASDAPTPSDDAPTPIVNSPVAATLVNGIPSVASPESAPSTETPRKSQERASDAPSARSAGAPHSLMPVETASASAASDDDGLDVVPKPIFSAANFRRVAIAAAIVVGIALPAWLARRAPSTANARDNLGAEKTPATASQPEAPRVIEADENGETVAASTEVTAPLPPPDPARGLELRRQARQLLEAGQIDQGVALARRAIEANPADPECYVLLAAGLQDQGRWQESREVFSKCVHRSNNAINSECAYFATAGPSK